MINEERKKEWDERIKICFDHVNELNDWEQDFIHSMKRIRSFKCDLTIRQSFKLNKIFYKICNNSITGVV